MVTGWREDGCRKWPVRASWKIAEGFGKERSGAETGQGHGCWGGRKAQERVGGDVRPPE